MAKKTQKADNKEQAKDYAKLAAAKKKEVNERKKEIRDNKKFTGNEMFESYVGITGTNPFTRKPHVNKLGRVIAPEIGKGNYPNAHSFSAKLNKNKKDLSDNLTATAGIFPTLNDEQETEQEAYQAKRKDIVKKNAGIEDLQAFYQANQGRLNEIDSLIETKVESAGNLSIYKKEISNLEGEHKDLLQTIEDHEEERQQIMNKRLLESNFDMITEQEIINAGISQKAQEWIDIMIDF